MPRRKISFMNVSSAVDHNADYFMVVDMSEPADTDARNKRALPSQLDASDTDFFNNLAEETTIANDDYILIYSESLVGYRKITKNFFDNPVAGASSLGWIIGGRSTSGALMNDVSSFVMPTETCAATATQVTSTCWHGTVSDHSAKIYTFGGTTDLGGTLNTARCEMTLMSTGVTSTDGAFSLTGIRRLLASCKTTSSKGYLAGGIISGSTDTSITHKTTYATSTASLQASAYLTADAIGRGAANDGTTKSLFLDGTGNWNKIIASTDILSLVNHTTFFPPAWDKGGSYFDCMGTPDITYTGNGGSSVSVATYVVKILLATECLAFCTLRWPQNDPTENYKYQSSMSDGATNGWSFGGGGGAGGIPCDEIYRIDYATDTPTYSSNLLAVADEAGSACNDIAV